MLIPRPIISSDFEFVDRDCRYLAEQIYTEVNATFMPALDESVIKSYRTYNDNFIPLIDFPVLKIYKDAEEELSFNTDFLSTAMIATYALAFTQAPKVGDISTFVSKEIRRVIKNLSDEGNIQLDATKGISIDYEDFIDPQNVIYKYSTLRFSIFTSPSSLCNIGCPTC